MNLIVMLVFYSTLFLSPILVISSSNIILMWLSLEMGVFSFLPMISSSSQTAFSTAKYFFIQSIGSVMVLTSSFYGSMTFSISLIVIALMLKLGMVPFHFWLPSLVNSLQTKEMLVLLVWQKVAPLFVMVSLPMFESNIKIFISLLSASVGSVLGLKQTQWRQIFTFSSISHLGWIIMSSVVSIWLFFVYFLTYALSLVQIFFFNNKSTTNTSSFFFPGMNLLNLMMLLSLAGLPPMLGFLMKMLVVYYFMGSPLMVFIMFVMISFSIVSMFFYLKIFFSLSLFSLSSELSRNKIFMVSNLVIFFSFPLLINF